MRPRRGRQAVASAGVPGAVDWEGCRDREHLSAPSRDAVAVRIAVRKLPVFPSDDEVTNGRDMCAVTTERQTLECFAWKGGVDGPIAWCGFDRAS